MLSHAPDMLHYIYHDRLLPMEVLCQMKEMTLRELKQRLKNKSHDELVNDISTLFTKFEAVKEYYTMQLGGAYTVQLLDKYKRLSDNPVAGTDLARSTDKATHPSSRVGGSDEQKHLCSDSKQSARGKTLSERLH